MRLFSVEMCWIQKFYKDLQESGRIRKEQKNAKPGLSNSTVRGIHMMLHNAFDRAVKERLILRNPTEDCISRSSRNRRCRSCIRRI